MVICHIMCEFCIVDVKRIALVSDESPVEGMFRSIVLECIEFVLNYNPFTTFVRAAIQGVSR
jgi:hypothetical protein